MNISILTSISVFGGLLPHISPDHRKISFDHYAYAQSYTQQDILNYSRAGFEIELLRQQTYHEIKTTINQRPPNISCNQPITLQSLAPNVRGIADNYCNNTMRIIRDNNLSVERFNQLKQYYDQGGDFHQQVQKMLLIEVQK
ncbi:DUF4168 domain-containing protein [Xenococcus sp. PCC 7305]|uniref:DUF4168 domain-containing protein n=1 Tax=Xenococcus sp. PCC 7305 TaxID=102125 RepID=UPI001EE7060A|nr:DUF4168 domain-containing protein [Xenococcus sp. PCC 7305]